MQFSTYTTHRTIYPIKRNSLVRCPYQQNIYIPIIGAIAYIPVYHLQSFPKNSTMAILMDLQDVVQRRVGGF